MTIKHRRPASVWLDLKSNYILFLNVLLPHSSFIYYLSFSVWTEAGQDLAGGSYHIITKDCNLYANP